MMELDSSDKGVRENYNDEEQRNDSNEASGQQSDKTLATNVNIINGQIMMMVTMKNTA